MPARTATVTNICAAPGLPLKPLTKTPVTAKLNTIAFTVDGTTEKAKVRYADVDPVTGVWSMVLEINDDLDPVGTSWIVKEPTGATWTIQLTAAEAGLTVNLRAAIVADPTNPNPIIAGVSQAQLDTAVASVVGAAPGTLDTLKELADALGDDPNYAATVAGLIGGKVSSSLLGAANGVATLDGAGVVAQVPKLHAARHAPGGADDLSGSYVAQPAVSDAVGSVPVKQSGGAVAYGLRSFPVDAFGSVAAAYAALVAAGGGRLVFSAGTTYSGVNLTLNSAVPTEVYAHGAVIQPAAAGYAFVLNAGRSQSQVIQLRDVAIDCTGISGGCGVKIVDHYGATLRNVRIVNPATGVLITDATGWSESSQFDNVYVKNPSVAGIDVQTAGGTGSFGYASWGLVHVDNIPAGAAGFRCGNGAAMSNSTINRLILHSSADTAIGMQVAGNMGTNTVINAVIESLASSMASAIAVDVASTGTFAGSDFNLNIITPSGGGGWGTFINNPSTRPLQFRLADGRKIAAATNQAIEQSGVIGDAQPMFSRSPDGTLRWGPGGSTSTDTTLSRSGVGALVLAGALQINSGNFNPFGGMRLTSGITTTSGTLGTASAPALECDASAGSITRTLYNTTNPGFVYFFTKVDSSANPVTIAPPGGGTINGSSASLTLAKQGDWAIVWSTATSGAWAANSAPAVSTASKSSYYFYATSPGGSSTGTPSINAPRASAAVFPFPVSIARLFAEFTAAGSADSVFRIGVWADDGAGLPGTLLLDAGTISTGTGNAGGVATGGTPGVYEIILGSALVIPAWTRVHFGGACQGTTAATMRTVSTTDIDPALPMPVSSSLPGAGGNLAGWQGATAAGALAAFGSAAATSTIPRIGFKTS